MAHPPLSQQWPPIVTTSTSHHRYKPTSTNVTFTKKKKNNQRDRHNHKSQTHRHHPKSQIHSTIPKSTNHHSNQPTMTQINQTQPITTTLKNTATTTARERREIQLCARWWRARSERPRRPGQRDGGERDQRDLDSETAAGEIEQSLTEVRLRLAGDITNTTTQIQNSTNNPPKNPTQLTHLLSQPITTQSKALPLDKERRKKIFRFDLSCKERERRLRLREELGI